MSPQIQQEIKELIFNSTGDQVQSVVPVIMSARDLHDNIKPENYCFYGELYVNHSEWNSKVSALSAANGGQVNPSLIFKNSCRLPLTFSGATGITRLKGQLFDDICVMMPGYNNSTTSTIPDPYISNSITVNFGGNSSFFVPWLYFIGYKIKTLK